MLDQVYLKQLFDYRDGLLIWKIKPARRTRIGYVAGTVRYDGRRKVRIDSKQYFNSRLVWIWHNGDIPEGLEIDHINRDKSDDRIENLRVVTRIVNIRNKDNYQGNVGYYYHKQDGKYSVIISLNSVIKHVRLYATEEKAKAAADFTRFKLDLVRDQLISKDAIDKFGNEIRVKLRKNELLFV
jgi:hypothetical protein